MRHHYCVRLQKILLVLTVLILSFTPGIAEVYFVSTQGSDSNDGSISSPWRTVLHAWHHSGGGDTVFVRGGTYTEHEMWFTKYNRGNGIANTMWTLIAYPGEEVKFTNARFIIDVSYVRIKGLILEAGVSGNSFIDVVSWDGIHDHIEILDNKFTGNQNYPPIYFIGNNSLIQGNIVDITGSVSHGIYIMHGSNNIIRNNYITGMYKYGIQIYDEEKYPDEGHVSIRNILVENNTITGSQTRSGIIISAGESTDLGIEIDSVIVRNNVITNNADAGIAIYYYGRVRNVKIFNNTIYGNDVGVYVSADDVDSVTIKNNIFAFQKTNNIIVENNINYLTVDHNLYWQPSTVGTGVTDNNPVYGDPLFVDAVGGDFHLMENSPAIDAGVDVGLPFSGTAPDLGAFEYGLPVPVELSSFKAFVKEHVVHLVWQTYSETNNYGFEIERSLNLEDFSVIGFVKGHGTTSMPHFYQFMDKSVREGIYYYRLKQLNLDGTFKYSSPVKITVVLPRKFDLRQNYPNPFNPDTKIDYCLSRTSDIDLSIFDITGRRIITLVRGKQSSGWKTITWNGRDKNNIAVASGIYFYKLQTSGLSIVKKMVLAR